MPLHTLMADIIESQGGTHLLIKILNRFGICASSDTLSRFIQYQVNALKHKNDNPLELEGFTIVSADNIDFLHSYASIFCGNQASSWHSTTIQAGQPLPSLSLCESFEFSTTLGEPTHRHLASAAPLGEPTHRHLTSAAPLGEPTHRHLTSAAPLGEPTHRHLASAAPLGEPTHRHLTSAAPLGEPTHRHLASAAPLGEPTHRHLTSAAPLGEATHRHLTSAAPLGAPTHRHLTSAAPLGEPTHRHLASAAALGEPTHRHLASAAPLGEPTHRHLTSAAPLGEPTHRHLTSAAPLGEPTHRHLASAAPLGEPTHRHLTSAAALGEATQRHLASTAALGEPTHRHLASFELSIPISGPESFQYLLQDFSAMEVGTNTNGTDTQSRKRTDRSSPIYSPLKTTRSPAPKIRRRIRTGTEKKQTETDSSVVSFQSNWQTCQYTCQQPSIKDKTIAEFKMREEETMSLQEMHRQVHTYMFQKHAVNNTECEGTFLNIQDYFSVTQVTHTEKSRVVYLEVMDAIADSKDTMMQMLHELSEQYIIGQNCKWLIVEGDAKVYDILQSIKFEYSDEVKWLIPYPGDWHMLKNYQLALMKPYFDAGLKSLAKAASYPLAAIQSCGQFKSVSYGSMGSNLQSNADSVS